MIYIGRERLLVSLVRMTLTACGRNDMVVQVAAANPMMVKKSMGSVTHGVYLNVMLLNEVFYTKPFSLSSS